MQSDRALKLVEYGEVDEAAMVCDEYLCGFVEEEGGGPVGLHNDYVWLFVGFGLIDVFGGGGGIWQVVRIEPIVFGFGVVDWDHWWLWGLTSFIVCTSCLSHAIYYCSHNLPLSLSLPEMAFLSVLI